MSLGFGEKDIVLDFVIQSKLGEFERQGDLEISLELTAPADEGGLVCCWCSLVSNPLRDLACLGVRLVAAGVDECTEKDELAVLGVTWDGNDDLQVVIDVLLGDQGHVRSCFGSQEFTGCFEQNGFQGR